MSDTMMRSLRQGFGSAAGRAEQVDAYQKLCHQAADRISRLEAEVARKDGALRMVGVLKQLGGMMPGSKQIVDSVVEACAAALKPAKEG